VTKGLQDTPSGRPWWKWGQAEIFSEGRPWNLLITPHLMPQEVIKGIIPYLGTFLTDLKMLNSSMEDYLYMSEPGPEVEEWSVGRNHLHDP
jgi:hypothetical protein